MYWVSRSIRMEVKLRLLSVPPGDRNRDLSLGVVEPLNRVSECVMYVVGQGLSDGSAGAGDNGKVADRIERTLPLVRSWSAGEC